MQDKGGQNNNISSFLSSFLSYSFPYSFLFLHLFHPCSLESLFSPFPYFLILHFLIPSFPYFFIPLYLHSFISSLLYFFICLSEREKFSASVCNQCQTSIVRNLDIDGFVDLIQSPKELRRGSGEGQALRMMHMASKSFC